jgi:membrane dipeptidase
MEGLHGLDGKLERIDELFAAGVRMAAPTHFFDTELGGSAHGLSQAGLTEFGKKCLFRMQELGIAIDLAHASAAVIQDACALATKPVIVSHTGVKRSFDSPRNLSDESLKAVAKTGGVVGIGFFSAATGGEDINSIIRAMKATIELIGVGHVALGSDWDGTVKTPFDAAAIPRLTEALIEAGFSEEDLKKILGENVLRVLRRTLPD